jgi:hypothetical protein
MTEPEAAAEQLPEAVKFYAAVLYPDGDYSCEVFDALPALVERIKELIDKDVSVFTFAGEQLKVSKPPFRHLLTPWGPQPLFDIPKEALEPDDTGYLGVDPIHLAEPPEIKNPKQNASSIRSDEFFDDSQPQEFGVFDNVLPDPDS